MGKWFSNNPKKTDVIFYSSLFLGVIILSICTLYLGVILAIGLALFLTPGFILINTLFYLLDESINLTEVILTQEEERLKEKK